MAALTDLDTPAYDGDRALGGSTPEQVALSEAIEQVNALFAASGLDLGNGSGEAWTRAVWGVLTEDEDIKAMSAENSPEQLQASPKFKDKVTGAVVSVAADSAAMTEAAMANPDLYDGLVELLAKITAIVHGEQRPGRSRVEQAWPAAGNIGATIDEPMLQSDDMTAAVDAALADSEGDASNDFAVGAGRALLSAEDH
ncbi:MAG: hypothetical protein Q4G46_14540 [Propionibacteriaceae bacterium]|nr:hypothetical protein [Propionibacteriaceae bacterium]